MPAVDGFTADQNRSLERCRISAESEFIEVQAVRGQVHVLRSGVGPPVVMGPGFADPAAMWVPLMAGLEGFMLYAIDRRRFGLPGMAEHTSATFRTLAVDFLEQVIDALGIGRPLFVANALGSVWSTWLAPEPRPGEGRTRRPSRPTKTSCPTSR